MVVQNPGLQGGRLQLRLWKHFLGEGCPEEKELLWELMRFLLFSNPVGTASHMPRGWASLAHTSKLVLLLYGCFDSLTCTSIPGSSMNWQAARAMVPSMFSRQPWSTFCRIWWDTRWGMSGCACVRATKLLHQEEGRVYFNPKELGRDLTLPKPPHQRALTGTALRCK